ncbi:hypothetical protein CRENBAI_002482 [Crenichthys baileyi]|uniref:B30.2/SPRY domain-containing protein n=1 Tax=Crenichthys baileyi TaxID=28760 RepID=A0AAV9SS66_9TELE
MQQEPELLTFQAGAESRGNDALICWECLFVPTVIQGPNLPFNTQLSNSNDCAFEFNNMSWSLSCSDDGRYSFCHDNKSEFISLCSSSAAYHKVGVYVDHPAGTLSFFRASSATPIHLHTLKTEFIQPLYPGFGFWTGSSVAIC